MAAHCMHVANRWPPPTHTHVHTDTCPSRGRNNVVLEHALSSTAILSYILFWMVAYNLGHVF